MIVAIKKNRPCKTIEFAVRGDSRNDDKEKIVKYQDLARALLKISSVRIQVIPLVVDSLTLPVPITNECERRKLV